MSSSASPAVLAVKYVLDWEVFEIYDWHTTTVKSYPVKYLQKK